MTINLPVESVLTIIDCENKNVEIPINVALSKFSGKYSSSIQSLNAIITVSYADKEKKIFEHDKTAIEYNEVEITNVTRKKIERTNELKFFNVKTEFSNGIRKEFIVPSYVKFYSSMRGFFVPVEYIRNRDILLDYKENIVKIEDAELVEDFTMTDFYNMNAVYNVDLNIDLNEYQKRLNDYNFYLNGILANISYNNFQKKEEG